MGLLKQAYDTFECNARLAGRQVEGKQPLCPVAHIMQNAHITVELDGMGRFITASAVARDDMKTIIPATEKSASRTSGIEAHPLCDQVCFVSGQDAERFEAYVQALSAWAESEHAHPMLKTVLAYVRTKKLLSDLNMAQVVALDENGDLADGKINGIDYAKCMIRWQVGGKRCWTNTDLFDAFQAYYISGMVGERGLCMVSGQEDVIASSHDKGIIPAINSAKLISSNDSQNFTYRGRFKEAAEACTVGYTASQKAHKALRWLAENQGVSMGGRTFLCWNPQGHPVAQPTELLELMGLDEPAPIPSDYYERLKNTLHGYRFGLPPDEGVVIAAFDAASTGRMAVTLYAETTRSAFHDRVEHWYRTCCWPNGKFGIQPPPLLKTVHLIYGVQRAARVEADERVVKEGVQRLFRCVISGKPVPKDMVRRLTNNVSQPMRYDENSRHALLHAACALVRKYRNDIANKEEWTMELDEKKRNRSYHYGRLLATMELAERATYDSNDGKRVPNAIKLENRFFNAPQATAQMMHKAVRPYLNKMEPGLRSYYQSLIEEVHTELDKYPDEELNLPLEDTYLMGYYLQRNAMFTKKTEDK